MADEKLIFPIGFDLEEGVTQVEKDWGVVQRRLQKTIDGKPLTIKVDSKGLEQFETYSDNMRNSINKIREAMKELDKTWNNMSDFEKFDEGGNLTSGAQELVQKYNELTIALQTYGKTLGQIASDAKRQAEEEVKALERKEQAQIKANRASYDAQVRAGQQARAEQEKNRADYEKMVADFAKREQAETRLTQRGLQYEQERIRLKQQAQQASDKEYENLVRQIKAEQQLAANQANRVRQASYNAARKQGLERMRILNAEEKSIDAINRKLQIQQQRLQSTDMGSAKFQKIAAEVKRLTEELDKANARVAQLTGRATQGANQHTRAVERTNAAYKTQSTYLSRLVQRMVAYASIAQVFSFIRNIRDVTAEFELQRVALGSIIGDLNEANAMFEQIKAAAVKSPFQIKELVTYTKQLAAYKIESDELFETTQRLADISAGLGVGMERLVLAYGQIRATGYLRASEVRQLTEAGIPIVEELAKKMSDLRGETVSAAEVMGMISERAISFGMVKEVFDDMTSAGGMFYKMQEKQAETLAGQWSNLQDSIAIMYEEIGNTERANNSIKGMIGLIKSLAENWRDVWSVVQSLSVAMGVYYVAMKSAAVASKALSVAEATRLSTLKATTIYMPKFLASTKLATTLTHAYRVAVIKSATATGLLSKAFWGLTKAMLSNPYTAVLAALAGLATLLLTVESRAKRLSKELSKIGKDGAIQIDQSARNFERLAKAIRESADGSEKQTAALAELKRSYGELLPSQDKEIKALVQEKANYDALIKSIKRKIELQIQEQKINKIASEYGTRISGAETDFKSLLAQYGLTKEDANKVTSAVKDAVDAGLLSVNNSAKENAHKLKMIIKEQTGLDMLKGVFDPMQIFTQKYGKEMRNEFGNLVGVMSEYNAQIEEVGGSLDHLDDKGKNLSDTFNTWQKELEAITEGKNLKGEGIRIFDDETISQISKVTNATSRVADEYKRLAEEKKSVDKALLSEGVKADKETYANLETRLGNINQAMSMLYDFLKKYGGLDLITEDSDKSTPSDNRLANLKEEISLLEKVYARYKEYRQYMSAEEAKAQTEGYFGDTIGSLRFGAAFDDESMKAILNKYKDAMSKLPKSDKDVIELGFKVEDIDWQDTKTELEDSLKRLSDQISRTKTAKEFFDRMLGMTGDKELSASLTVSIYGGEMGDDLGERLARDMASKFQEQVQTYFGDIDISSAINEATGEIDPIKLEKLLTEENIEKMGKDNAIEVRKIINDLIKANADYATELFKSYEKFFDYEKRMTMVTQREEEERKKIRESMIPDDQKAQLEEASKKREQEQISAIEIEQLKDTADWEKTFEDLNNLGSLTVKNLISLLEEYIAKKKEAGEPIAESDMKTLMNELNQLRERDAQLDPFETIKASLKDLTDATTEYNKAKKDGDEEGMAKAQDKRAKALNKLETAVNAVASGFQNLSNLLTEFQEVLGIEDDSAMGEVFNGAAKALGFVATALSAAIALTLLWNSTLWANPLFAGVAIVSGVLGAIAGVFSAIANAKVRKANKEIERQQELLDQLAYSYERLEKAQEKAFGSDYISNYEQRMANLQAQQDAYLKQASAERSKGKKADEDKIKEYEEQARETADAIKDMQSELSEYFLGTDLTSAARDFANAWIEAYKEFGSTTDAMKEKFQDMIQNMIVESFAARVIQTALSDIFTEIDNMTKDGVLDMSEASKIADMTEVAVGNIDVGMTNLMNALSQAGISVRGMGSDLTGISKDIATASEESILGLAAGINTQNFYISQVPPKLDTIIALLQGGGVQVGGGVNMQDLITIQNQHLSYLPSIAQHTADTVAECKQIVVETRRTADALERVIKPRGTQATHTVNTSL